MGQVRKWGRSFVLGVLKIVTSPPVHGWSFNRTTERACFAGPMGPALRRSSLACEWKAIPNDRPNQSQPNSRFRPGPGFTAWSKSSCRPALKPQELTEMLCEAALSSRGSCDALGRARMFLCSAGVRVWDGCSSPTPGADYAADDVGIVADMFRLAQAAGVSSAVWLIGRSANPGRIEIR